MINVIICVTSEKNSISKALASVAFQTYKKVKVIVVDSTLSNNVKNTLELFNNKIDYLYIKSDKLGNVSYLRNIGIKNADGDYIMFLDENDVIHDIYSLDRMISKGNNRDIISGKAVYYNNVVIKDTIYGNMYKREFINKYNLVFNESLELDNSFATLCIFCTSNITTVGDVVYFRNDKDKLDIVSYNLNMYYIITEGKNRKCKDEELNKLVYSALIYNYFAYLQDEDKSYLKYASRLYKLLDESKLSIEDKKAIYSQKLVSNVIPNITLDEYFSMLSVV